MGRTTIEWTCGADRAPGRTWYPVTGCTKLSPASLGCHNCYTESIAERLRGELAYPNGFDVQLCEHKLTDPLRWRKPARVFVISTSDLSVGVTAKCPMHAGKHPILSVLQLSRTGWIGAAA